MIPELKTSQEAMRYGESIKNDRAAQDEVKAYRRVLTVQGAALLEKGSELTDGEWGRLMEISFLVQLLREVMEAAEGLSPIAEIIRAVGGH